MGNFQKAEEEFKVLDSLVNGGESHIPIILDMMSRNHRTLQQNFTRMCMAWIEIMAKKESSELDARNRESHNLCKFIHDKCKEESGFEGFSLTRSLPHI